MRKCHYTQDEIIGKILIPGCWEVVVSNDIRNCSCDREPESFAQFENQQYKKKVNEQIEYIRELEKEVSQLNRIIKRLIQKK